jgi:hypothetical protein
MIVRYVFVRLKPPFAEAAALAELRARSHELARIEGVRAVSVGLPADDGARAAWDLAVAVRFDSLQDVERYLAHPEHTAYYEGFLEPRLQVIKAWNFME